MCGIAVLAGSLPDAAPDLLRRMRDTMTSRGPDSWGDWWSSDGRVGFGHRRLAILDLSPTGHQPMLDGGAGLRVTFNGEIYNYRELRAEMESKGVRFSTRSDTEVILKAYATWGESCVQRFNGMFAFALLDEPRRRLFLARDRAGEKPLYYRHAGGRFSAASELKAILNGSSEPRVLDLDAFEFYIAFGFVPGAMCLVQGIRKLPPAHIAVYDLDADTLRISRYWSLPDPPERVTASADALVNELDELLADSVARQMHADVPVGILLSGGVDSSLVTAMAHRAAPESVSTFTVSFPGHGAYDESAYAALVARHFGTMHHELVAEPASVELLPVLARQFDEPIGDTSIVPTYLVSKLIREHATVALGGDGGDELFGGYLPYSWLLRQDRLRRRVPAPVRRSLARAARWAMPHGTRGRNFALGYGGDLGDSIVRSRTYFDRAERGGLLAPLRARHPAGGDPESYVGALSPDSHSAIRRITATDFSAYLTDDILVKVDRASMLTSLEVRAPWLDYRIIEFAFGRVPDHLRATPRERKILPRRLAQRLLPRELDLRRKQGFSPPLNVWFAGPWGDYMRSVLLEADPRLFDRAAVAELVRGQAAGRSHTHRLFALTLFELWRREYGVVLP